MDIEKFQQRLAEIREKMDVGIIDEIPLDARPKMVDFDFNKDSYVVISYSRKDFVEVYLFLAYLYQEGYRFWYDNGMQGDDKWLNEFKAMYENPNCLGTITFYSDNYISNSTKEELSVIYGQNGFEKRNAMISLVALRNMDPDKVLKNAILADRISIENAAAIKPMLSELIATEKEKTIYRYAGYEDIPPLAEKLDRIFSIRNCIYPAKDFLISDGVLFKYLGKSRQVVVPSNVRRIGEEAFCGCATLERVILPEGLSEISTAAFADCPALTDINIPEDILFVGNFAFSGCTALTSITLPECTEEINDYTFLGCTSLTNIDLPRHITEICDGAFSGCKKLTHILLPYGVTDIGEEAFCNCTALESVTIPESVTSIGDKAFYGCPDHMTVYYGGSIRQWKAIRTGADLGLKNVICLVDESI